MQTILEPITAPERAATLLDPTRIRLLERFREPASAAEAARALELPRQRVGHHVRLLRRSGLLRQVGERRAGNFIEQLLQTSARAYVIAPQALGGIAVEPDQIRDRFSSSYLLAAAARTIGDMTELQRMASDLDKKVPSLTIETEIRFGSAAEQGAFAEELAACLASLASKYHDERSPDGRSFRFTLTGHPAVGEAGHTSQPPPDPMERGVQDDETTP